MTLLAPLGSHPMRSGTSHLRMVLVYDGSRTWRATTHTRRRMLHWDISHGRGVVLSILRCVIPNNGRRYLGLRPLLLVKALGLGLDSIRHNTVLLWMSMLT